MAIKKNPKKVVAKKSKISAKTSPVKNTDNSTVSTDSNTMKAKQWISLLSILLAVLFIFQIYSFYRLISFESKINKLIAGSQPAESALSIDKLKEYAKDLKLDMKKFNTCLDKNEAAALVSADLKQGGQLGVQGTPGFFINGKFLGGAFPFEIFQEIIDKELSGQATGNCSDYSESLQEYCKDAERQSFKPNPVEVVTGQAPSFGSANAKVTIVEFSDFECPYCARTLSTIQTIVKTYKQDVRIVFKHFPLTSIHPNAQKAAEATVCAQKQGKFWDMHDKIFQSQGV